MSTKVTLTRQRIKSNVSFAANMSDDEMRKRLRWSAAEDTERNWSGPWTVTDVEIVKVVPEEYRPTAVNQLNKVIAVVTETRAEVIE